MQKVKGQNLSQLSNFLTSVQDISLLILTVMSFYIYSTGWKIEKVYKVRKKKCRKFYIRGAGGGLSEINFLHF